MEANNYVSAPGSEMSKFRAMAHFDSHETHVFENMTSSHYHHHQTIKETIKLSSPVKFATNKMNIPSLKQNGWIMTPLSKCAERPCFLAPTHFYAKESNYTTLKMKIDDGLCKMEDYDISYFDAECMWKCKYLHGSDFRENHVTCYWDSTADDHVVEVKKYRGDGFYPSIAEFYLNLKQHIIQEETTPSSGAVTARAASPSANANKGRLRGGALPMPVLKRANTAPATSGKFENSCVVTEEMFLKGIQPLFMMAEDNFLEPRLEAAKALCDLAKKEKKYLELSECREKCVHAINALLRDDFEDVKQFAVMAFASFCEIASYQESFSKIPSLSIIVGLVRNCSPEAPSFECAQIRRKAAEALANISQNYPTLVKDVLEQNGFRCGNEWNRHVESLIDQRLRNHAMNMTICYNDY